MPQRDIFHDVVKSALIKDGWTITHDPFILPFGVHNLYIDLGAERAIIAAEKTGRKIAVEIKSFIGRSEVDDLENALGQYILYRSLLQRREPERTLYLAVPMSAYNSIFSTPLGRVVVESERLKLIVFEPIEEVIQQWTH
jgi:hypothetical protein